MTDVVFLESVASRLAQHERLCRCLADTGWSNVELHLFIVGHTGVLYLDKVQSPALLEIKYPLRSAASRRRRCGRGLQLRL